jgi:PKD repeat protein
MAQQARCVFGGYNSVVPVAAFTASPERVEVGRAVVFDGSFSRRPDGGRIDRWAWDLDGNGSFETAQAMPTASKVYIIPGRFTVRLVVSDACGQTSSLASRVIEVVPDATAPKPILGAPSGGRLSTFVSRGIRLGVGCDEPCRLTAIATVSSDVRRKLRLPGSRIASTSTLLADGGTSVLRLRPKLSRAASARVRRVRSGTITVKLTSRDASGNASSVSKRIRIR